MLVGVSALACTLLVSPGSAKSKLKKIATTSSKLTADADSVSGTVLSRRTQCKRGRKVTLRSTATGKQALGKAKTTSKGRWLITIQLGSGTYFADVKSATRMGKANGNRVKFHCRAVKSAPLTL